MRVALYNRWIDTLGGGEQTLGAFAAALADQHDVELLAHEEPDWSRFRSTLGLDLAALPVRLVDHDRDHYRPLQSATRDYDLFINCSYLDHVRAYARVNVLQVFFPPAPPEDAGAPVVPAGPVTTGPRLRPVAGLHALEGHPDLFAWTDGHARFELVCQAGGAVRVTLSLSSSRPRGVPPAVVTVGVDGTVLRTVRLPARRPVHLSVLVPAALLQQPVTFLDVHSDTFDPTRHGPDGRTQLGVRLAGAHAAPAEARPVRLRRPGTGLDRWTGVQRYSDAVATYDLLLANSHFTQRWIARRYGRGSALLYPPVQVGQFTVGLKKPQIISVGRFFVEGHSKKQLEMISAFRRLCDDGLTGWTYHLVGGTHHDAGSARYLQECRAAAAGYPVVLHPDAPLEELARLYAESALYWNATGYGEDPDVEPDRFEHFGMTTVEAMASGCVPLSYARAGQPEVIEQGLSGLLFETLEDLEEATRALAADPARREAMSVAAVERSNTFTYERFRGTLHRLLADTALHRP